MYIWFEVYCPKCSNVNWVPFGSDLPTYAPSVRCRICHHVWCDDVECDEHYDIINGKAMPISKDKINDKV